MNPQKPDRIIAAADYFNAGFCRLLTTERGIHTETVIASSARMAGTMLFRSFVFPGGKFEPGTTVLSEEANVQGPKLMGLLFGTLQKLGQTVGEETINQEALSTKDSHLTLLKTQELFDPLVLSYCSAKQLDFEEAAFSLAMTSAVIVHDCQALLDVQSSASIALYGFIEGSKTAPIAMNAPRKPILGGIDGAKKPWYKLW